MSRTSSKASTDAGRGDVERKPGPSQEPRKDLVHRRFARQRPTQLTIRSPHLQAGASRATMDIVPAIVDLAAGRVPVVAAGGIADGRGLAASLMLGADGVLMGTRFYASREADGHEEAKKRICAASAGDTIRGLIFDISRKNVWPSPFTGRCLVNDHVRRWVGRDVELLQNVDAVAADYAAARAAGNFDIAAVIAGEAVGLIHDIPPAGEIIERMIAEGVRILEERRNSFAVFRT